MAEQLYNYKYDYGNSPKPFQFHEIIENAIANAGDSDSGIIETMQSQLRVMATIIVCLCHILPPEGKLELAKHFSYEPK